MKPLLALLLIFTFTSISAQVTNPKKTEDSAPKITQTADQKAILQKAQEIREKLLAVQKKLESLDEFQLYQAYEIQLNQLQQAYDAAASKPDSKK